MHTKLTAIVLTHNDEEKIVDCLERLTFVDELIIIDDNSTDRTVEIANQFTKSVFVRQLRSDFATQRNFALNQAHGDWVLFVDSDELISKELESEIINAINSGNFNSYFIKRIDYMWGRKILHGEVGKIRLLRLAKKGWGKWHGKVHETWKNKGNAGNLFHPLIHTPHNSVWEFVKEVDEYSTIRSNELFEKGSECSYWDIISYPIIKFIQNYILRKGYKDEVPGFIYAMMMSFHSFLVRAKLYQQQHSSIESQQSEKG